MDSTSRSDALRRLLPSRSSPPWVVVSLLIAGGLAIVLAGVSYLGSAPAVCASCHEMVPKVETWRVSAHTRVGCPSCHETPRPWYRFYETVADRAALLARDVGAHLSAGDGGVSPHDSMAASIPDSTCERCHDPSRQITLRYGTLIDHSEHAERNGSCVSCHLWTAHPDPDTERSLLLMQQCFTCHGRTPDSEATGTCDTCHPEEFDLRPASHEPDGWQAAHGGTALNGQDECLMCHDESVCSDCHGVRMPHPADWASGLPGGGSPHGLASERDPAVCSRCHPQAPEFCAMCHHEGYDPGKGPWVEQHPVMVEQRGASFCFDCHDPVVCMDCHTTQPLQPEPS